MKHTMRSRHVFGRRAPGTAVAVSAAAAVLLIGVAGSAQAATAVGLGTAGSFVVLAGTGGVTNTGPTTLNGDIGAFPVGEITGTGSMTITGTNHGGDGVTQGAKNDLVTAYDNAAGQGPTTPISVELGGRTLLAGVYNSAGELGLTGTLTLDAAGDPNAVFVFQAGSTLITASGSQVALVNGAQACNVFWQVGSSATLGTGSAFRGTVLALTSIQATTGATIEGRVLARNGGVTLDTNVITAPVCTITPTAPATTAAPDTTGPDTTVPGVTGPETTVPGVTGTGTTVVPGTTGGRQVTETPRGGVQTGDGSTVDLPGAAPHRVALPYASGMSALAFVPTQWSELG